MNSRAAACTRFRFCSRLFLLEDRMAAKIPGLFLRAGGLYEVSSRPVYPARPTNIHNGTGSLDCHIRQPLEVRSIPSVLRSDRDRSSRFQIHCACACLPRPSAHAISKFDVDRSDPPWPHALQMGHVLSFKQIHKRSDSRRSSNVKALVSNR